MHSDPYSRAILTLIALCLLVLVAHAFGVGRAEPEPKPAPAESRGRWTLQLARAGLGGPPLLLRLNTDTGEVWQTRLGANQEWRLVGAVEEAPTPPAPAPEEPPATVPEAPPQP